MSEEIYAPLAHGPAGAEAKALAPPPPSDAAKAVTQALELTRKNLIVARRRPRSFLLFTCAPALFVLLLFILKQALSGIGDQPTVQLKLQKCSTFSVYFQEDSHDCATLAFAPSTDADAVTVMKEVAVMHGLDYGTDVVPLETAEDLAYRVTTQPGTTEHGVLFVGDVNSAETEYQLWFNSSDVYAYGHNQMDDMWSSYQVDGRTLAAQIAIDEALVRFKTGSTTASMDVEFQGFTQVYSSELDSPQIPIVLAGGCAMITVGVVTAALVVLLSLTDEKRRGLVGALRAVGLSEMAYWASYLVAYAMLALLSGVITASVGTVSGIWLFSHCSFFTQVLLTACFQLSMSAMCMFFASFVSSTRAVNTACFFIFAWSTIQVGLSSFMGYTWIYKPSTSPIFKFIFFLLPFQHYGAAFTMILDVTSYEGAASGSEGGGDDDGDDDDGSGSFEAAVAASEKHFHWSDMYDKGPLHKGGFYAPNVSQEMCYMLSLCFIYLALAWYCGQVAASEHGSSRPLLFFLMPSYWGFRGEAHVEEGDTIAAEQRQSLQDDTVRIHKLSKSYEAHTAVREVSLTLQRGEICALLGQNGAGKSSLIKVLSGLIPQTHGHAFAFGLSVKDDIKTLQPRIGSCPQDDMLFDELTAREHVFLFGRFKGMTVADAAQEAVDKLELVALTGDADNLSSTFSGGMKRRLSVAMASTGDPDILFLDEPTTGMDPLSRQRVWAQIQQLKAGRIVLLTTHSMEEADILGDRIAIMSKGSMRAVGSSLFLKSRFGAGYQVSLLSDGGSKGDPEVAAQRLDELQALITDLLPGAEIVGSSAGQLTVGLPKRTVRHIPDFFRRIEGDLKHLVKEWGISNSTLEEVFLRLCSEANTVNQVAADFSEVMCALCNAAPAETVTLYTEDGVAVVVSQVVCHGCATGANRLKAAAEHGEGDDEDAEVAMDAWHAPSSPSASAQAYDGPVVSSNANEIELSDSSNTVAKTKELAGPREPVSVFKQARAIVLKNLLLELRQKKTNWCRLIFVVVVVLLMILLGGGGGNPKPLQECGGGLNGYEHTDQATNCTDLIPGLIGCDAETSTYWYNGDATYCCPYENAYTGLTNGDGFYYCCPFGWFSYNPFVCYTNGYEVNTTAPYRMTPIIPSETSQLPDGQLYQISERGTYSYGVTEVNPRADPLVFYSDAGGDNDPFSEFLAKFNITPAMSDVIGFTKVDGTNSVGSTVLANQNLIKREGTVVNSTVKPCTQWNYQDTAYVVTGDGGQAAVDKFAAMFPDVGFELSESNLDERTLKYKMLAYTDNHYSEWAYTMVAAPSGPDACIALWVYGTQWDLADEVTSDCSSNGQEWGTESMQLPVSQSLMSNLLLDEGQSIKFTLMRMPIECYDAAVTSDQIGFQLILFPLISSFMLPVYVGLITTEKAEKLFTLMTIEGLHGASYWIGMYAFGFIIFSITSFLYMTIGYLGGVGTFTNASPLMYIVLLLCWSHAQVGTATFIASVITSPRFAQIFAYALIIVMAVLSATLNDATSGLNPYPFALLFVPPLAYSRAMSLVLQYGGSTIHSDLSESLLMMLLTGTVWFVVGVYLHAIVATRGYVPRHPLYCLLNCKKETGARHRRSTASFSGAGELETAAAAAEDDDVRRERERVTAGEAGDSAILLVNLEKEFPGGKKAVNGVCLGIEGGQCFGLLGPNGAGKTTIISILSGSVKKSAGEALVGGCDVATEMDLIHSFLGVCPQFDVCWPDLRVSEHLLFYARLKGVPSSRESAVVQRAAERVDLDGDAFNMTASELSGGMRRRLSLGIALIGDPSVVFLDEPTTGLDPESRREIWDAIQRAREQQPESAFVLTTHSMEEADILSTKIGIMSLGSLRCIGTPQHLKAKFGDGFKLGVVMAEEHHAAVHEALRSEVCRGAQVKHSFGRTVTYALPREHDGEAVSVATVFNVMERLKKEGQIDVWELAQSSLEEVFVRIALAAEEQAASS